MDGLWAEEIVLLESHAALEVFLVMGELDGRDVLDDESQCSELLQVLVNT